MRIPLFSFAFPFFFLLALELPLHAFPLQFFWRFLHAHLWVLEILRKPGMRSVLARLAFRTEASQVELTQLLFLVVFQCAYWAKWAEASIVVGARWPLRLGVDVEVETVVAIGAGKGAGIV